MFADCCLTVDGALAAETVSQIQIKDSKYSTADSFKAAVSGVQFCYPLATPIIYQLPQTMVKSMIGTNNVWADTGDVESLTYWTH